MEKTKQFRALIQTRAGRKGANQDPTAALGCALRDSVRISVSMSPEDAKALRQAAEGVTISSVVRRALRLAGVIPMPEAAP